MYLDHFGLDSAPFNITSQTDFFYDGAARGATLDALLYAVQQGEGIVKVTGEVGSGKTMLCRMLLESLPDNVETIFLSVPSLKRDEIVQALCIELELDIQGRAPYQLLMALQEKLIDLYAEDRRVLTLIDEAHAMPLESLEQFRLLSNLENSDHKLLQIILFGQPELDDHLQLPHMRQLKERITHSFQLPPMEKSEIGPYLAHRLESAGYSGPPLFSNKCIKLMADASEGLTRRINIIADKSLLAAYSDNTLTVTPEHVRAAIHDSDFPMPNNWGKRISVGAATVAAAALIAFGFSKIGWFSPGVETSTTPVAKAPATVEAAPVSAPKWSETPTAAELVIGSPDWHERNLNKNNKLNKPLDTATSAAPPESQPANITQLGLKSANFSENLSKMSNSDDEPKISTPKTGFDLDSKIDSKEDRRQAPLAAGPTNLNTGKNRLISAKSSQSEVKSVEPANTPADPAPAKTAELKVAPNSLAGPNAENKNTQASTAIATASSTKSLQDRISSSKTWLDSQPAGQCLIQLLMADINNHGNVEYFLNMAERQVGTKKIHVFPSEINGQGKYTVVYGEANMNCLTALEKLPAPLKQSQPYIRSVELLRNEAKFPG